MLWRIGPHIAIHKDKLTIVLLLLLLLYEVVYVAD